MQLKIENGKIVVVRESEDRSTEMVDVAILAWVPIVVKMKASRSFLEDGDAIAEYITDTIDACAANSDDVTIETSMAYYTDIDSIYNKQDCTITEYEDNEPDESTEVDEMTSLDRFNEED